MSQRQLKVSYAYYDSEGAKPHPFIRLQGRWLEKAGFPIGSQVTVIAEQGNIIIVNQRKGGDLGEAEGHKGQL